MPDMALRPATTADRTQVLALYPDAFPDEDLVPLVVDLMAFGGAVHSIVAVAGAEIVGHIVLTPCAVTGSDIDVALLAPLAVARQSQRQGLGRALIETGLRTVESAGCAGVLVLGDPAYYGRFGFVAESAITPPYPLPDAYAGAWQSIRLGTSGDLPRGQLVVPGPWRHRSLWGP